MVFFVLYAIPHSEGSIAINKSAFVQILEENSGRVEIHLSFPDVHHPQVFPVIFWMYNYQQEHHPKIDLWIIPKYCENIDADPLIDELKLPPFPQHRAKVVAFGGAFDHLHNGHKLLITAVSLLSEQTILIGVNKATSKKKFSNAVQPYNVRAACVVEFIYALNDDHIIYLEKMDDIAGPAGKVADIDLLVISEETIRGGEIVNQVRVENGLKKLDIVVIPLILSPMGHKLSSTDIRQMISENQDI